MLPRCWSRTYTHDIVVSIRPQRLTAAGLDVVVPLLLAPPVGLVALAVVVRGLCDSGPVASERPSVVPAATCRTAPRWRLCAGATKDRWIVLHSPSLPQHAPCPREQRKAYAFNCPHQSGLAKSRDSQPRWHRSVASVPC